MNLRRLPPVVPRGVGRVTIIYPHAASNRPKGQLGRVRPRLGHQALALFRARRRLWGNLTPPQLQVEGAAAGGPPPIPGNDK